MVLCYEQGFIGLCGQKVSIVRDEDAENVDHHKDIVDIKEVAQKISRLRDMEDNDDPFTVLNLNTVYDKLLEWRERLPNVKPYYAVKCNNDPVLLKVLASLGVGFDCASRGEIDMVVGTGIATGEDIIYANPCKTRSYIEHAEKCGIRKMTYDNSEELVKIKQFHSSPQLILRIDVADDTAQCPLAAKFGCEVKTAPRLMLEAKDMGLDVIGFSFHVGSGCKDPSAFMRAISASKKLFGIGKKIGHEMRILDIGGGFPGQDTEKISFNQISKVIRQALATHFPQHCDPVNQMKNGAHTGDFVVVAEPGRFFSGTAVSLCANVISKAHVPISRITKNSEDKGEGFMYYINDGVYGSFNCILFDHFQPKGEPLFINRATDKYATTVWGPTCDSLDQVEANVELQEMNIGDWMYYPNMGAYTSVAASNFNGFKPPQRYYIIGQKTCNSIFNGTAMDKDCEWNKN